jgi:hypothetical protein
VGGDEEESCRLSITTTRRTEEETTIGGIHKEIGCRMIIGFVVLMRHINELKICGGGR